MPLAESGPEIRMVESLQSMWDEEKLRIGGSPPPPPPEPLRTAQPLCQHIEVVRAQLQVRPVQEDQLDVTPLLAQAQCSQGASQCTHLLVCHLSTVH